MDADPALDSARPDRSASSSRLTRGAFLRGVGFAAAGVALGPSAAAVASPSRSDASTPAADLVRTKIANLTGPELTTRFRMEATDLGIPATAPDGRTLWVFGDTFERAVVGGGFWRSPVALWSETSDLASGVTWSGAVGGETAEQLWYYEHDNPVFSTVLPSDVITIGNTMYLHVMVNKGLGNVVWTEIWRSDDSGASWYHTDAFFPPDKDGGLSQLWTWGLGNDGYVYVYSTGFQRDKPIILHRVPADRIADPSAYEPWGWRDGIWAWGHPPTPILTGSFGEMSLRPIDGRWMLTWFNAGDYRMDALIMDTPTSNLYEATRATLLWGGAWGQEDDAHVAQLYGGYLIPGSTIDDLHLSVSQWNTDANWPYRVMQFRIQGLGAH